MPLTLGVIFTVASVVAIVAAVGYLIDRSADRREAHDGRGPTS